MLKTLDVLIGFTLVMLIMSMAVTMLTQLIGSAWLNLRGRALKIGLARLLALLDRGLTPAEATRIADHILRNPLIAPPRLVGGGQSLAPIVHREEFVKLILDFAAAGEADQASDDEAAHEEALRNKIRRSLEANGIADPAAVLIQIRNAVTELERTSPELSHAMRLNMAILRFAASDFLSKLNAWFDQTIDRVSDIFTARTRLVTALIAIAVAFVLQLDAIGLINRLSTDNSLRDQLVASAIARVGRTDAARNVTSARGTIATRAATGGATPAISNGAAAADSNSAADANSNSVAPADAGEVAVVDDIRQRVQAIRAVGVDELHDDDLINFPRSYQDWVNGWGTGTGSPGYGEILMRLFGILLTAALLSLGAPFWYSTLSNLVKLRSVIAQKDDNERSERQTSQAPATAAGAASVPPAFRGGEAGDLAPAG
jgi:hypothetical protein